MPLGLAVEKIRTSKTGGLHLVNYRLFFMCLDHTYQTWYGMYIVAPDSWFKY